MKIRRYKIENGVTKIYYEETKDDPYEDIYSYGGYNGWKSSASKAPEGTVYCYLEEFKDWGYSEEVPKAYLSCIYSKGMEEKIKKMLNAAPLQM